MRGGLCLAVGPRFMGLLDLNVRYTIDKSTFLIADFRWYTSHRGLKVPLIDYFRPNGDQHEKLQGNLESNY